MSTSVQVRVAEVDERRVQRGRDSDTWLGSHFEKSEFPSSHHREEGWRRHQKMARSLLMDAAGVVFLVPSIGTPPHPREKRVLRSIFLIARPPLLAVMRGGNSPF